MDTTHEPIKLVKAYPNIALIKYWGKYDIDNHLPYNSSLSISVDNIYTITGAKKINSGSDVCYLNGVKLNDFELKKITTYLDKIRNIYSLKEHLEIRSRNFFPTAAGLASSASGYAAMAKAIDIAYDLNLTDKEVSKLARLGSVSAARSVYGDFVILEEKTEFAYKFEDATDYSVIFVIISSEKKSKSSRDGMKHTVNTSAFYDGWLKTTKNDFENMKDAILNKDFTKMGELTESSCLKMHATMLGAEPYFTYLKPESLKCIEIVRGIRESGLECYFTMDAGSNVKVLCKKSNSKKVYNKLLEYYNDESLILCNTSKGYEIIEGENIDTI